MLVYFKAPWGNYLTISGGKGAKGHQPVTTSTKKLPPSSNSGIKIFKTEHWQMTKHLQHGIISAALNCVCGSAGTAGY